MHSMPNQSHSDVSKERRERWGLVASIASTIISLLALGGVWLGVDQQDKAIKAQWIAIEDGRTELGNRVTELENQKEQLEAARDSFEQNQHHFEELGPNLTLNIDEVIGYKKGLSDPVIVSGVRVDRQDVLPGHNFDGLLYEFTSELPFERINLVATVTNTGRDAASLSGLSWFVRTSSIGSPLNEDGAGAQTLEATAECLSSSAVGDQCEFPVKLDVAEKTKISLDITEVVNTELPCLPEKYIKTGVVTESNSHQESSFRLQLSSSQEC